MRFANPIFLVLSLLVPVAGLWWSFLKARREKALLKLTLNVPTSSISGLQTACIVIGLFLALFAAARPQWGKSMEKTVTRARNVVIAIDVSRSMLAEDVRPNRLERAKADVADLIDSLAGDRCALVAFRRTGVVVCPLTTDHGYLRNALERMSPESVDTHGPTDIGSAIRKALSALDPAADDHNAIIIISDGFELHGEENVEEARKRGIPIFTVGIGDPAKGTTIPAENGSGVMKESDGKPVMATLDESALKKIAEASKGRYVPLATAGTAETTLGAIYRQHLRKIAIMEQNEEESRLGERYQIFLVPGLVLLLLGAALSKGRFAKRKAA